MNKVLNSLRRSQEQLISALAFFVSGSGASVDHRVELLSADQAMGRGSGVTTNWAEGLTDIREIMPDSDGTIPLDTVASLTLSNNRSLRADLESLGQAKADQVQASLLSNPILSIMTGLPEGGGRANVAFGLSQDFADLWLIPVRKKAALAMVQQRILSFTHTAIALLNDAKTAYYRLQYQVMAANLQEENLRILSKSLEIARGRMRAGAAGQLDVNLVLARYVQVENALLQVRAEAAASRRSLLRLMGVAKGSVEWQPTPMSTNETLPVLGREEAELVEIALLQRLDVQAARWELEASIADIEQQRRRVIPNLMLGLSGERFERRAQPGRDVLANTARASVAAGQLTAPELESRAQRRQERRQEIDFILGPSIEIPLPIFDQNQARIAKAKFRARELEQRLEEIEQRVVEGVRIAYSQTRLAEGRVRLYRETLVPLQESSIELGQFAYQAGRESILIVLLAQESLNRTRLEQAAAIRDFAISTADLERQLAGPISVINGDPELTP